MYVHLYVESLHPNVSGLRILFGNFDSTCLDAYTSILIGASIVAGAHLGDDLSFHVVGFELGLLQSFLSRPSYVAPSWVVYHNPSSKNHNRPREEPFGRVPTLAGEHVG